MTPDDSSYEAPFDTDEADLAKDERMEQEDRDDLALPEDAADLQAAHSAWEIEPEEASSDTEDADPEEEAQLAEIARPFVGRWNELISTTNWEKGRIIGQWREALIESGASSRRYSDEAWARRVGGVTAPHVGRLRRVYERFGSTYQTYSGLYWSHFLAALDWDDAPLWLEGASREQWSVSQMREQRWQAHGAVESKRPMPGEIVEVDTDEDVVLPAQGGGRTKEYGDEPGASSGPVHEGPDFGDEDELMSLSGASASAQAVPEVDSSPTSGVQPFAGLPELPDDLADAIESLKLAVLRHKSAGWLETDPDTIQRYLDAIATLIR